jgi:hypothetical protein
VSETAGLGALGYPPLVNGSTLAAAADVVAAAPAQSGAASDGGRRELTARALGSISSLFSSLASSALAAASRAAGIRREGPVVAANSAYRAAAPRPSAVLDRLPNRPLDTRVVTVTLRNSGAAGAAGARMVAPLVVTLPLRDPTIVRWDAAAGRVSSVEVGQAKFLRASASVTCPISSAEARRFGVASTYTSPAAFAGKPGRAYLLAAPLVSFSENTVLSDVAAGVAGPLDAAVGAGDGGSSGATALLPVASPSQLLAFDCGPPFGNVTFLCGPGMGGRVASFACPSVVPTPTCLWWDGASWTTTGCAVANVTETSIACACNRTGGNFAARFAALDMKGEELFAQDATAFVNTPPAPTAILAAIVALLLTGAAGSALAGSSRERVQMSRFLTAIKGDVEVAWLAARAGGDWVWGDDGRPLRGARARKVAADWGSADEGGDGGSLRRRAVSAAIVPVPGGRVAARVAPAPEPGAGGEASPFARALAALKGTNSRGGRGALLGDTSEARALALLLLNAVEPFHVSPLAGPAATAPVTGAHGAATAPSALPSDIRALLGAAISTSRPRPLPWAPFAYALWRPRAFGAGHPAVSWFTTFSPALPASLRALLAFTSLLSALLAASTTYSATAGRQGTSALPPLTRGELFAVALVGAVVLVALPAAAAPLLQRAVEPAEAARKLGASLAEERARRRVVVASVAGAPAPALAAALAQAVVDAGGAVPVGLPLEAAALAGALRAPPPQHCASAASVLLLADSARAGSVPPPAPPSLGTTLAAVRAGALGGEAPPSPALPACKAPTYADARALWGAEADGFSPPPGAVTVALGALAPGLLPPAAASLALRGEEGFLEWAEGVRGDAVSGGRGGGEGSAAEGASLPELVAGWVRVLGVGDGGAPRPSALPALLAHSALWFVSAWCAFFVVLFGLLRGDSAAGSLAGAWALSVCLGWGVLHPLLEAMRVGWAFFSAAVGLRVLRPPLSTGGAPPLPVPLLWDALTTCGRLELLIAGRAAAAASGRSVAAELAQGVPLELAAVAVVGRAHTAALAGAVAAAAAPAALPPSPPPLAPFSLAATALRGHLLLSLLRLGVEGGGASPPAATEKAPYGVPNTEGGDALPAMLVSTSGLSATQNCGKDTYDAPAPDPGDALDALLLQQRDVVGSAAPKLQPPAPLPEIPPPMRTRPIMPLAPAGKPRIGAFAVNVGLPPGTPRPGVAVSQLRLNLGSARGGAFKPPLPPSGRTQWMGAAQRAPTGNAK